MEHYLPLVKFAALKMASRNGRRARPGDADDLLQYGVFGLRDAIRGFDPARGFKFETYCLQRIRGAMLDGLKAGHWVPRDLRRNLTRFAAAREQLEGEHGSGFHAQATAQHLGISEDGVHELHSHATRTMVASLSASDETLEAPADALIPDHREEEAPETLQRKDVRDLFLRELTRQERHLMLLYYYEDMTMREIGQVLGLSGTRVSQIHSDIVARLRSRLAPRVSTPAGEVAPALQI
ncbi:MAG TPA: sigma-70 family RNA polymerase sigma factor [Phycisphaerae bacterium]|jgi:RNA polymerase sigma factor for flagellar operon FliA|nr:sigma-70 family RNA polymerase sigma factor [Phycisphaerae bacterium]